MTTKIKASNIETGAVTADKLHTTAITDKLGYTPVSPTTLSSAVAAVDLTGLATETYVNNAVAGLVDSAPSALNTLNELAAALNDDANFASTITTALGTKANQSTTYTKTEVDTALNLKANQSTTYTKTEVDTALTGLITFPTTGVQFRPCQSFSDFSNDWKYSGNFGPRGSAPITWQTDQLFSNFNYNISSWQTVNCTDNNGYNVSVEDYYWYISKLFYIKAGTFTYSGFVDDDEAWYLVPYAGGTPISAGGDITDRDGSGAHYWSQRSVTVSTSGFYRFIGRGIDGGGGNNLGITSIDSGLSLFYVPSNNLAANTVINVKQHSRGDFPTTTDNNGFEFLYLENYPTSTTSKFLVQATVAGQSGDDSRTYIEYRVNGGSWNLLGPNGQMGDHSWSHRSNNGAMSLFFQYLHIPYTTSRVDYRVRPTSENSNNGGMHLNHGIDSPGGYNEDYAQSALIVWELA